MKWNEIFNFTFEYPGSILIALIPALINFGILGYILIKFPPKRITFIFALFVFSLTVWQINDALVRMSATVETALFWNKLLAFGALLITPTGLHFTLLYTGKNKQANSPFFLFLLYFPAILFLSLIATGEGVQQLAYSEYWRWLPTKNNSIVLVESLWVSTLAFLILALLIFHAIKVWKDENRRYQALLIAIGFAIPTIQGTFTQVIFPQYFHISPIPIASSCMTAFSIAIIIALIRYKLFHVSLQVASDIILDTITDLLYLASPKGNLLYANPAGMKAIGIEEYEIESYSIEDLFAENYEEFKFRVIGKLQYHHKVEGYQTSLYTKGNGKIPVLISAANIYENIVQDPAILIVVHDITKIKKIEEIMKAQTTLYESLLRAQSEMGEGVTITDGNRIIYANDAICNIYGYKREELMALPSLIDLIAPDSRKEYSQKLKERLEQPGEVHSYGEVRLLHKSGRLIDVAYSFKIFNNEGRKQIFSIVRDITQQKQIEQSLVSQARITKSILDQMAEGLIITDEMNNFILYNSCGQKITGVSAANPSVGERAALFGSFLLDKVTPLPTEQFPTVRALKGEYVYDMEAYVRNSAHQKGIFISMNGSPIKDETGKIVGSIITFRDISERKKVENYLKQSQAQLATAQQLANLGSWEWDFVNNQMIWSDELYRIYGINCEKPDGFWQEDFFDRIHTADREYVKSIIEETKKSPNPFSITFRIVRGDNSIRTLFTKGDVILNNHGQLEKIFGISQDMTDRIQEEEMEKLVVAATKSCNSVIIADREGKIEWVNEGFTQVSGYSLAETKGSYIELMKEKGKMGISTERLLYESIIREKKPITFESENYTKDGKGYWIIRTLTPVIDREGHVDRIIIIDSDITLRKQMEKELVQANRIAEESLIKVNKTLLALIDTEKKLKESMKVKEQFLAKMSHEIRTPMNAIVGMTDLVEETELSTEQKECIDAIKVSGENLLSIINDILDFSKLEAGQLTFEKTPFNLEEVFDGILQTLGHVARKKGLSLTTSLSKDIPGCIVGDMVRLRQILLNLVNNAIKFTDKGSVRLLASLKAHEKDEVAILFSVEDTGIGIPADKIGTIFESFTQASYDTSRKYGGTGLGLSIVKQLVEMQGARVSVESRVGEGSIFSFMLRYAKDVKENTNKHEKEVEMSELQLPGSIGPLKVLLVEDNILNQMLVKKILDKWGFSYEVAENGKMAIEQLSQSDFDIILMDVEMPEMDGYKTTQHIRNNMPSFKSTIPIIAMTAHAIVGEAEKCIKMGMNDYISKPFSRTTLYKKIVKLVKPEYSINITLPIHITMQKDSNFHKFADLSYLKKISEGSDEFMKEMMEAFLIQTPEIISDMNKYVKEQKWSELRGVAHKMKPSVDFMGLTEIKETVREIEKYAAEKTHLEELPNLVLKMEEVCIGAMNQLKEELKKYS